MSISMSQVLPGRLGRLQEAETRRIELEEAKRQEIVERSEKKKREAEIARQTREAARQCTSARGRAAEVGLEVEGVEER